jgi:hypothetical protein
VPQALRRKLVYPSYPHYAAIDAIACDSNQDRTIEALQVPVNGLTGPPHKEQTTRESHPQRLTIPAPQLLARANRKRGQQKPEHYSHTKESRRFDAPRPLRHSQFHSKDRWGKKNRADSASFAGVRTRNAYAGDAHARNTQPRIAHAALQYKDDRNAYNEAKSAFVNSIAGIR